MRFLLLWFTFINVSVAEPRTLSWQDLIPEGDAQKHTSALHIGADENAPAAAQLEPFAPINPTLDQTPVRLPGYIVPLGFAEDGKVTEFFLVPYYGACIHVPPPPANQIIYVKGQGLAQRALWQPYWVEGVLLARSHQTEMANAGYQLNAHHIEEYALAEP